MLVSGGHTQLIAILNYGQYKRISTTLDDAVGETFDKSSKMLGLGFPGGPVIEELSEKGNEISYNFPRPMFNSKNPNFSFSGLKNIIFKNFKKY